VTRPVDNSQQMPKAIWTIGFVSLLMDVSSELTHSLLPIFMVTVLAVSALIVGLIEGLAALERHMVRNR
jgi:hypothetical protein